MRLGHVKKRLLILALAVATIATLVWQGQPALISWNQRKLAHQIARNIEQGHPGQASGPLRRLANFGTPSLQPLVTVASSPTAKLSLPARKIVSQKLAAWEVQAHAVEDFDLATPMIELAAALLIHADQFDASGSRWAAGLAIRMTHLTRLLSPAEAAELLGECNRILVAIPAQGPRLRTLPESIPQQVAIDQPKPKAPEVPLEIFVVPSESYGDLFSQLEITETTAPEDQLLAVPLDPEEIFTEPPAVALPPQLDPWSANWSEQPKTQAPPETTSDHLTSPPIPGFYRPLSKVAEVLDVPTPQEMKERQQALRKISSRVLITQLLEADRFEAGSIRLVLRQRGFAKVEFELANLITSSRVEDRNQLIDAISTLPAESARRWLRWLLQDDNPDIRLQALTALATANDPQLFNLARELATQDQDDRVSDLASKIMRQVR